ncbi:MAG: hypothetical protein JW924_12320 [Fusobacteriaceae bacterium]|nr:hypothetical protein [Fusobacteriaceae bacterium]
MSNYENILHKVKEIAEEKDVTGANFRLNNGWILLSTHLTDYGHPTERHQKTIYCFGRIED